MGKNPKKDRSIISEIGSACPYTILGKKAIQVAKGEKSNTVNCNKGHINEREQALQQRVKTGRNIALIGVFCPFFWFSVISGASSGKILFNGIHSGIVILIGLIIMWKGKYDSRKIYEKKAVSS